MLCGYIMDVYTSIKDHFPSRAHHHDLRVSLAFLFFWNNWRVPFFSFLFQSQSGKDFPQCCHRLLSHYSLGRLGRCLWTSPDMAHLIVEKWTDICRCNYTTTTTTTTQEMMWAVPLKVKPFRCHSGGWSTAISWDYIHRWRGRAFHSISNNDDAASQVITNQTKLWWIINGGRGFHEGPLIACICVRIFPGWGDFRRCQMPNEVIQSQAAIHTDITIAVHVILSSWRVWRSVTQVKYNTNNTKRETFPGRLNLGHYNSWLLALMVCVSS